MFIGKILFFIQTSRLCAQRPVVHIDACNRVNYLYYKTPKPIYVLLEPSRTFLATVMKKLIFYYCYIFMCYMTPFQNCIYIIYCWFQSGATECDALINRAAQSDWPFLGLRVLALPKNLQVCMNVDSFPYLKN